jgi:hypothetical protein
MWVSLLASALGVVGCGDADSVAGGRSVDNVDNGAAGSGSGGTDGSGGTGIVIGVGGLLGVGGGSTGSPTIEADSDGVDNDGNGIVDDVDVGGDGVCDCLNIATLGRSGAWGTGNIFSDWLNSRSPKGAQDLGDQVLTEELIREFQVIVALDVSALAIRVKGVDYPAGHAYSDDEAAVMQAWITSGGGLMTTIGNTSNERVEVENINKLLAFSGMAYSTTLLDTEGDVRVWEPHPVTEGMGVARIQNGVQPEGTTGEVVGWDAGDRVALKVHEVDSGRIAMWGDEWITYDEYWADVAELDIELLWLNLLKWLTPPKQCQVPIPVIR